MRLAGIYKTLGFAACTCLLASCDWRAAAHPERYAPRCYNCSWEGGSCVDEPNPCLFSEPVVEQKSLNLTELLEVALQRNPKTMQTWAEARIAAANYGLSQQNFYPQVNANAFWQALREPGFFGSGAVAVNEFREYAPYLSLNYLLLDFGTTRWQADAFRQQLIGANLSFNRSIQTLIKTVSMDYYAYVGQTAQVEASEANVRDAKTTLEATEAKHRAGVSDLTDVLYAKTQVAKQTSQLVANQKTLVDDLTILIKDMGLPASSMLNISTDQGAIDEKELLTGIDHYLCLAYTSRPDLKAAYARMQAQHSNIMAARMDAMPKVTFDGLYGTLIFNEGINDGANYSAQFSVVFPLFSGYFYENQIKKARAQLELASATFKETELEMVQQVVASYHDLHYSYQEVAVNREYVEFAEGTYKAALAQYKAGTTDITQLVNVQTDLADARYALAAAKQSWFDSLAQLIYALGTYP
ncbi:MAG: TolC family protein [Chlamydiia bacterium]|nr:TolC family protein [Chlamydiia bacterium]